MSETISFNLTETVLSAKTFHRQSMNKLRKIHQDDYGWHDKRFYAAAFNHSRERVSRLMLTTSHGTLNLASWPYLMKQKMISILEKLIDNKCTNYELVDEWNGHLIPTYRKFIDEKLRRELSLPTPKTYMPKKICNWTGWEKPGKSWDFQMANFHALEWAEEQIAAYSPRSLEVISPRKPEDEDSDDKPKIIHRRSCGAFMDRMIFESCRFTGSYNEYYQPVNAKTIMQVPTDPRKELAWFRKTEDIAEKFSIDLNEAVIWKDIFENEPSWAKVVLSMPKEERSWLTFANLLRELQPMTEGMLRTTAFSCDVPHDDITGETECAVTTSYFDHDEDWNGGLEFDSIDNSQTGYEIDPRFASFDERSEKTENFWEFDPENPGNDIEHIDQLDIRDSQFVPGYSWVSMNDDGHGEDLQPFETLKTVERWEEQINKMSVLPDLHAVRGELISMLNEGRLLPVDGKRLFAAVKARISALRTGANEWVRIFRAFADGQLEESKAMTIAERKAEMLKILKSHHRAYKTRAAGSEHTFGQCGYMNVDFKTRTELWNLAK